MQHRNAVAVAGLQRSIAVDEHTFEFGRAGVGEDFQGEVAKLAVVALEKDEWHTLSY